MSAGDFRLGLVVFREHIQVLGDLDALPTPDAKKALVADALSRLAAAGGEQIPELSAEALATVLNRLPPSGRPQIGAFTGVFEADVRIVILITDQLPGGIDDVYTAGQDDVLAAELARKASSLGIKISAVYVPTQVWPDAETQRIMQTYANETLGLYIMTDRRGFGAGTLDHADSMYSKINGRLVGVEGCGSGFDASSEASPGVGCKRYPALSMLSNRYGRLYIRVPPAVFYTVEVRRGLR
jgi:hypothetical protein